MRELLASFDDQVGCGLCRAVPRSPFGSETLTRLYVCCEGAHPCL